MTDNEKKMSIDEIMSLLEDAQGEESNRAYEMAEIASNIIWLAREYVEAHAGEVSKKLFKEWTDQFLPLALKAVAEDDHTYLIPDESPAEFGDKYDCYPFEERGGVLLIINPEAVNF